MLIAIGTWRFSDIRDKIDVFQGLQLGTRPIRFHTSNMSTVPPLIWAIQQPNIISA